MNKNVSKTWVVVIVLFIAAIYSILLFALKKDFTLTNWIGYGFTILSFLILMATVFAEGKGAREYPVFSRSRIKMAAFYVLIQLIFGGILAMIFDIPDIIVIIVCAVLLTAAIVLIFVIDTTTSYIRRQDEVDHDNVSWIRLRTTEMESITRMISDPAIAEKAKKLSELIKYSDPGSISAVKIVEERIEENIHLLEDDVYDENMDKAADRISRIELLIKERNDKIAALKS